MSSPVSVTADDRRPSRALRGAARSAVVALASVAVAAAGAAGSASASNTTSGPGAGASTTTSAVTPPCVTNVHQVVHAEPTSRKFRRALPQHLRHRLDDAAREGLEQAATPGAIVGVRTPRGTWTKAYGFADPANLRRMQVGTHTRIGSVTKTFTGTLLLQLAQEGRLSLDDPISDYVAGVPNGDDVTLRHLANMTSGVASYTQNTTFTDRLFADPRATFDIDELIAIGLADSPLFAPGAAFHYSNTNFLLLGTVIEKVTGERLGTVYRQRIFRPLGLDDTTWPGERRALARPYAKGFTLQGDTATPSRPSNATHWSPSWAGAAGAIVSTMPDLLTYGRALGTGRGLLRPGAQADRLRSFPRPSGYGLALGCVDGWIGHTGELPGYNTTLFYDTTSDTTVVVQANSDIASGDCPESPTLADDPRALVCSAPATRIFVALSTALGHTFVPPPMR